MGADAELGAQRPRESAYHRLPGLLRRGLLAMALVVASILFTRHLTGDLYGDEYGHTYKVIRASPFWWNLLDPSMCHPPLYFVLARICYEITGRPWGIRLPSIAFGLGTVLLVPLAARQILGQRFVLVAAWVAALSPFLLEFAAEGRAYAMMIFFSVAFLVAFHAFVKNENRRTLLALIVTAICGVMTHYFFCFQVVFAGGYYLASKRRMTRHAWYALAVVGGVILSLVTLLFVVQGASFSQHLQVSWSEVHLRAANFVSRLAVAISYGYCTFRLPGLDRARNFTFQMIADNWPMVALTLVSFGGIIYAWTGLAAVRTRWFWLLAMGIAVPVVLGLLAAKAGLFLIREKHLAIVWFSYVLLLVVALHRLARSWIGWGFIGCYMAVTTVSILHYTFYPNEYSRRMDWTGLGQILSEEANGADCIVAYGYSIGRLAPGLESMSRGLPRQVNIRSDRPEGVSLAEFARYLRRTCKGKVFLVVEETERLSVDPNGDVIRRLRATYQTSSRRFGRNLTLYVFGPGLADSLLPVAAKETAGAILGAPSPCRIRPGGHTGLVLRRRLRRYESRAQRVRPPAL